MKKFYFLLSLLMLLTISTNSVWGANASVNTILWGENFGHFGTNTPSAAGAGAGTTIWGGATIAYLQSSTNTKGYNEALAGGTAPELLLSKSNQTWSIAGIPAGGATEMTLTFLSNKTTFAVTTETANLTISGSQKSWTISVDEGKATPETFSLIIKNTGSSNARIDDVVLKVKTAGSSDTPQPTVPVEQVQLNKSEITLEVDETETLTPTITPANATNTNVSWETSNAAVATIANGVITAVSAGDATITCKSVADPTKSATCAVHVNFSPYTKSSLVFTAACGGSGTADDGATWAVISDGEESTYDATCGIHFGTNNKSVTYLQLATSGIEGEVAKVVVNARDAQANATISVAVGGVDFTCTNPVATNTSSDFSFTGSGSGEIIVRVDRGSSMTKAIYVKSIVVYYIAAPQKDPAGLAYADLSKLVKLGGAFTAPTLTNPNSLEVTYTSDYTTVAEVASNGAVTIKAVGKAVITASSEETENYKAGSASYTIYVTAHAGTEADPYTVADARLAIDCGAGVTGVYATGIVSEIVTPYNSQYGNISYNISTDGQTTSDQLQAFRGKAKDGEDFTSVDDVKVGDEVVVKGNLTKYNSTYEFAADNQLYSLTRNKEDAGLAYAVTNIEKNVDDAAFTNALTNPHSLAVTYSSSAEAVATIDENGEVTIVGMGTTTIKATFAGDASYITGEASYTLKVNDPSLTKVTFDATVDKGESPLSKSNITLSCSNGVLNNESEYRLYKSSTTTFACSAGNIAMIEFIGVSGNPASGFAAPAEGNFVTDGNNATWTGNATSVSFEASGAQVRATKIFVSYREDTRTEAGLAYEVEEVEKVVGDEPFTNALTNPNSVYVSFTSSDETVAEVAANGQATIKAVGTTTISAVFEGNETYKPATVSYTLTVAAPVAPFDGDYFVKVTNANDLTSGEYLIVYGEGSLAFNGALETLDAVSNTIPVVFDHDKIQGTNEALTAVFTINATAGTIQSASGMYIGQTSDANGLATSAEMAYTNTITFDEEGNANIVSGGAYLRYNSASNQTRFRYYKSSSYTNQQTIQLYKKESAEPVEPELDYTAVRENLEVGRHYTICLEKKIVAVRGATFWGINNCSEDNLTVYLEMQQPPFDAGKPFIFHATAETLEVAYEGDAVGAPTTNGALRGTFVDMNAAALEGIEGDVYMMYNNTFRPLGSGNHLDAHRAYLLFDALVPGTPAPGRTVRSMPMQGNVTTDIEDAEASAKPMKKLIDGQLFIMCGEKLYDATGRQVK